MLNLLYWVSVSLIIIICLDYLLSPAGVAPADADQTRDRMKDELRDFANLLRK